MPVKIRVYCNTGFAGCVHEEIMDGPEDWETMTEKEREDWLDEAAQDHLANCIDFGAHVVGD